MRHATLTLLFLAPLLLACGGESATLEPVAPADTSHLLDADLPDAVGVLAVKESKEGDEVTVFGRVRQVEQGVFQLVDDSAVKYCGQEENCMDGCKTPWDYCCENPTGVAEATLVVEAKDAQGRSVAKRALGIRPLDLVAVRGRIQQDDDGTVVLVATSGWYRRERPPMSPEIRFP